MTQNFLLRLKHQLQIRILKQTAEDYKVVFLDICSANIVDYIITAQLIHDALPIFSKVMKRD